MGMEYQEWGLLLQLNDKREEIVVAENIDVIERQLAKDEKKKELGKLMKEKWEAEAAFNNACLICGERGCACN